MYNDESYSYSVLHDMFFLDAVEPPERTFGIKLLIHVIKPPVVEALLQITYVKEGFHYWWFHE